MYTDTEQSKYITYTSLGIHEQKIKFYFLCYIYTLRKNEDEMVTNQKLCFELQLRMGINVCFHMIVLPWFPTDTLEPILANKYNTLFLHYSESNTFFFYPNWPTK